MSDRETLREVVGELYKAPASSIGADFRLRHPRFQRSAERGLLAAAIRRRLGVYVAQAFSAATYGELEAAVFGTNGNGAHLEHVPALPPRDAAAPPDAIASGAAAPLSVGVDIEMVQSLPDVADFWTDDFYRAHFTPTEIAYCIQQEEPRVHFAARWCAKEALVKCDARYMNVDPTTIQVSVEPDGRPFLESVRDGASDRLPHAISLTQTPLLAAAVVAVVADGRR